MLKSARVERLRKLLRDQSTGCFIAATPVSMGYLADYFEDGHERLLVMLFRADGDPAMICPALSETGAKATGITDIRPWADGEDSSEVFRELAANWNLGDARIAVDGEMPARHLLALQAALPGARFVDAAGIIGALRKQKDASELDTMRRAAAIADEAQRVAATKLAAGMAESALADVINTEMRRGGGTPTFCIVGTGANGAKPHHGTSNAAVATGDVVIIDCGCELERYQSDTTRTICLGPASDEAKTVYRAVYNAHMAARAAIRPGVTAESVDAAARKVIADAGYGEYFIHRTGHGIGMQLHEPPNIVKGNADPLVVGQCFSVEPGIYLPGRFGVRIENIVAVTADGHETLNAEPPAELPEVS
ncbi:MAG: M24 family metallopeptidase [Planctomycetota bacterium]